MKPMDDSILTAALLRYHYDEATGHFFHAFISFDGIRTITGKFAGTTTPTGVRLTILGKHVMAHHLAWRIIHGEWPVSNVKHRNNNLADCSAENLYSPGVHKARERKVAAELKAHADFLAGMGITRRNLEDVHLEKVRATKGERQYILQIHTMGRINDDQRNELLKELENT